MGLNKSPGIGLWLLFFAVCDAVAMAVPLWIDEPFLSFRISELGGVLYLAVSSTATAIFLATAGYFAVRQWPNAGPAVFLIVVFATALTSGGALAIAVDHRIVGGEYLLPSAQSIAEATPEQLQIMILDVAKNPTVAAAAWSEMLRRSGDQQEMLWQLIMEAKRRYPNDYFDRPYVDRAISILAESGDERVIDILVTMAAHSQVKVTFEVLGIKKTVYGNREKAKKLLQENFDSAVTEN